MPAGTPLDSLFVRLGLDGDPYAKGWKDANALTKRETAKIGSHVDTWGKGLGGKGQAAGRQYGSGLGTGLKSAGLMATKALAGVTALAGGVTLLGTAFSTVKAAANFEYEMSRIKAVSGSTVKALDPLRKTIIQLGKDTVFSAGEAAKGANELVKAGLSVAETSAALPGTLALASAGEIDVAAAAEIASNAMNIFGLKGKDMMMVADQMSGAVNASSLEMSDLAYSLKYVGSFATDLNIPLQTVVAVLAELGNQGIKGEQAGAAFAAMLQGLSSPTDVALKAMEKYRIAVFDATGTLKPMPQILGELHDKFAKLNQQDKLNLVNDLFGKGMDASVALKLIGGGSAALDDMTASIAKTGDAVGISKTKLDNLTGSWEQLKGSLETLAIGVGTPALKGVRELVDGLTDGANEALDFLESLQNIEGWKGADLTGKVTIALGEVGQEWAAFEARVQKWLDTGGKADLQKWGDTLGEALGKATVGIGEKAANVFLGIIGLSDDVWGQAAQSFLKGLTWGAIEGTAEGLFNVGKDIRVGYEKEMVRQVQVSLNVSPAQAIDALLEAKKISEADAEALKWEVGVYMSDEKAKEIADKQLEALITGTDAAAPEVTSKLDEALRAVDAGAVAKTTAGEFVDAFGNVVYPKGGSGGLASPLLESLRNAPIEKQATVSGGNWLFGFLQANEQLAGDILHILGLPHYETHGQVSGTAFGVGFGQGFRDWLKNWNPSLGITDKFGNVGIAAGGSGFGADLLAELMQQGGSFNAKGLTAHTAAIGQMIAGQFGLNMISGFRPGATIRNTGRPSLHGSGRAEDWGGSTPQLWAAFHWLASRAGSLGIQELLYRDRAWSVGVPREHFNTNAQSRSDHMDHLHVGFRYHEGGEVPATLLVGERIITQEQNSFLNTLADAFIEATIGLAKAADTLPQAADMMLEAQKSLGTTLAAEIGPLITAIRADVNKDTPAGERTAERDSRIGDLFDARSGVADSYVSREEARLKAVQALGLGIDLQMKTVESRIAFLDAAVAEKSAQLQAAKDLGMNPAEINRLAAELFDLQATAADARKELQALARTPLEDAAKRWSNSLSLLNDQIDLLGNASNASALLNNLLPQQLGTMGAQYQTSLDLMGAPGQTPDEIMSLGQQASGQVMGMFGASKSALDRQLSDTMASIDASEKAWLSQWDARSRAFEDQLAAEEKAVSEHYAREREANQKRVDDLRKSQDAALTALRKGYDARLLAMQDGERAITRAEEQARAQKALGKTEDELRILQGQGFYTEADIARMRELETSAQDQRDAMAQQTDAWAREDARTALERERDAAVERLQLEQENALALLQAQVEAADERLAQQEQAAQERIESQRRAFEEERRLAEEAFQRQRDEAQAAYQAQIDALVTQYSAMLQTVQDQQASLLGQSGIYQNAGYQLGASLAQGVLDSLPLIEAAGLAAADALSRYLELHSPAKAGPLAKLDTWWTSFVPTILKPLDLDQLVRPVMDTFGPASVNVQQQSESRHEEHIYLHGDPGTDQQTIEILADKISEKLHRRVQVASQNYGS